MRFFANGPDIPNDVLAARDRGEVVFFCGAGVSMPHLPSFAQLAVDVAADLGANTLSPARQLLQHAMNDAPAEIRPSFDKVFSAFQHEYGVGQVEAAVRKRLDVKASPAQHRTILRLSRDAAGAPRVVTTNFDTLFEAADPTLPWREPPALPLLSDGEKWSGVAYLHGRLASASREVQGLVLGIGDFGRAYLTQAWATRFMRDLIARHTVILLGYSADDPPIQYLLQGLEHASVNNQRRLYAFADASVGDIEAQWRRRGGVQAIPYQKQDAAHAGLWQSLRAWAERADDPARWRARVITAARRGPRRMQPHQRGQVAEIVSTVEGARDFANADPPPSAEWLCVFDPHVRYARPQRHWRTRTIYDPLSVYGLDSDPPRPPRANRLETSPPPGLNALAPNQDDEAAFAQLAGPNASQAGGLTARLFRLAHWIGRVSDQPTALWWAAGRGDIHPRLRNSVEHRLDYTQPPLAPVMARGWRLLFEAQAANPEPLQSGWYAIERRLAREGWSPYAMRAVADLVLPRLQVTRPRFTSRPPQHPAEKLSLSDVVDCSIQFMHTHDHHPNLPEEYRPQLVSALRRALLHGAALSRDCDKMFDRTPTLYPETHRPGEPTHMEEDEFFLWFARSFEQLAEAAPDLAREEFLAWPRNEERYFDKLRLWASAKSAIATPSQACESALSLSQNSFWQSERRRELLWLLRQRWDDFDADQRARLEARIVAGPDCWRNEKTKHYAERKGSASAAMLGWLRKHGCVLSEPTLSALPRLIAADPDWRDTWIDHADDSMEGRGGAVHVDDDHQALLAIPLSEVIERAADISGRQRGALLDVEPFRGLVKSLPQRALLALLSEFRDGRQPFPYWRDLLSNWPDGAAQRLNLLAARTLIQLDDKSVAELRWYVCDWLAKTGLTLLGGEQPLFWRLWDRIFNVLSIGEPEATDSVLDELYQEQTPRQSRRTFEGALNAPIGKLLELIFDRLREADLPPGAGLPAEMKARMERALAATGESADHAAAKLLHYLYWMQQLDPEWADNSLMPLLDLAHPLAEPAWSGFLNRLTLPDRALFARIKPRFLAAFSERLWSERASNLLVQFLVVMLHEERDDAVLSFAEARAALQAADNEQRVSALSTLRPRVARSGWRDFGKPFLEQAWPRELVFQTAETSRALVHIAKDTGDDFPDAAATIAPFLRATAHLDITVHGLNEPEGHAGLSFVQRWPNEVLTMMDALIPHDSPTPFGLDRLLQQAAEAGPSVRTTLAWRRLSELQARR